MSWKEFIDGQLMMDIFPGYHLTASAIMDQEGYVWAQSETFPEVTAEEIASIMKGFSDTSHLAENGIFLGGTKYMLIQGEPGQVIRGKRGQGGVTVKKTHSALVFGIYNEPLPPSACNIVVEKLGDYLMEQNI